MDKSTSTRGWVWLAGALLLLSIPTFVVIFQGGTDEPYTKFRAFDCFVQVGVASILIALWVQLLVAVVWLVSRRVLSPRWYGASAWAAVSLFYLWHSATGYLADLSRH